MRGRDAAIMLTLKVDILQVFTIWFLRDPVYRESQLAIGWDRTKVQRFGRTCKRRPYISSHSRGKEKIPRTMVFHLEQIRQKMGLWNFDPILGPGVSMKKIVYTTSQANKLKSLFLQNDTGDGIPHKAHRGGTSLNWIGNELISFFFDENSFCYSWFRLQSIAIHCKAMGWCGQILLTRHFSRAVCTSNYMHITTAWLKTSHPTCLCALHSIFMLSMMCAWAFFVSLLVFVLLLFLSVVYLFSSTLYLYSARHSHLLCPITPRDKKPLCFRTMRSIAWWRSSILLHAMSPTSSTTSTTQRLLQRSSRMNPATQIRSPRTRVMPNSTMRPSEKRYLHHCSFRSEKNQRTGDKLITLMKKVCCQLSPFFRTHKNGETRTRTLFVPKKNVKSRNGKRNNQDSLWKTTKSKLSLKWEPIFRSTNFKPILIAEVSRNWMELLSLSEERLITLLQVMNNSDEINYFFKNNYQNKIGILREEDCSKIKTQLMNSRPEFRNYRMKLIVWMIREIFKMLNQYAVDYPTFPVNPRYSHFIVILEGCWAAKTSRQTVGIRMVHRDANPTASSASPYPGGFNPWISNVTTEHISPHVTSERQNPDTALDPRCLSGPSARNSFAPNEGRFSKDYDADQKRLQISDLHFDKNSLHQQHLSVGR